jgi:hypothetical protein
MTIPEGVSCTRVLEIDTAGPFKKAVWLPITMLVASGAAEMTLFATVTIGIGSIVGLAKNVVVEPFPPTTIPDEPTDTTTGLLFESVSVATDPGLNVEPFGRIAPLEPARALMELVPTTATRLADVGLGIEGVVIVGDLD